MDVGSKEIADHLYRLASIIESEYERMNAIYKDEEFFSRLGREAIDIRDLANAFYEANIKITV